MSKLDGDGALGLGLGVCVWVRTSGLRVGVVLRMGKLGGVGFVALGN